MRALVPEMLFGGCAEFWHLFLFSMSSSSISCESLVVCVLSSSHRYFEWGEQKKRKGKWACGKRDARIPHTPNTCSHTRFTTRNLSARHFQEGRFQGFLRSFPRGTEKYAGTTVLPTFPQFFHQETSEESWGKPSPRSPNPGTFLWVWDRGGYFKRRKL